MDKLPTTKGKFEVDMNTDYKKCFICQQRSQEYHVSLIKRDSYSNIITFIVSPCRVLGTGMVQC